jgi:glucuronosyltransferase
MTMTYDRFNTRAKELSSIFRDQMETPVERAVYWSEYVMRHKGRHSWRLDLVLVCRFRVIIIFPKFLDPVLFPFPF